MYSYINNKYNRMLYILLGLYIVLVFVFSLMFNGFFINSKAISIESSFNVDVQVTYNGNSGIGGRSFSKQANNTSRICIINDSDLVSAFEDGNSIFTGGTVIAYRGVDINSIPVSPNVGYGVYSVYDYNYNSVVSYLSNFDSSYGEYMHFIWFPAQYPETTLPNSKVIQQVVQNKSSIGYVKNLSDCKRYMKDLDDSVIKYSDPDTPIVDSQIPTPQKVAVYKDSTSPSLVWSNPKGITNNSDIKVHIEWKPVITLTHGLYDVHSLISQDYEMLYFGEIGDFNSFCTLNNNGSPPPNVLNSYNTLYDSKVLFSGTGAQQSNDWANYFILKNNVDWVSRVDPFGTNDLFGKGTYSGVRVPDLKYRIRYETDNGVSDWIYSDREFGSDNLSGPSQHSSTHTRNVSGDPVSNPTYSPNNDNKVIPQNEVDDQEDPDKKKSNSIFDFISGFFDTIISAISAIFDKLKELVESISNGTGSFFSFFADLFGAFPQLLGIFLLGLVVAVLLRVLGR